MERRDFFISYKNTEQDTRWAKWVAEVLTRNGYSVYYQGHDCRPGMDFLNWMGQALDNSEHFICIWSRAYKESETPYCMDEFKAGYHYYSKNQSKSVFLPIVIEDCEMPKLYSTISRIKVYDRPKKDSEHELISAIKPRVKKVGQQKEETSSEGYAGIGCFTVIFLIALVCFFGPFHKKPAVHASTPASNSTFEDQEAENILDRGIRYYQREEYENAFECFQSVLKIDKNNYQALNYLGKMYQRGYHVKKDLRIAFDYFTSAADLGWLPAISNLGELYREGDESGRGPEKDPKKALEKFEEAGYERYKAGESANSKALYWAGEMYEYGEGMDHPYPQKAKERYWCVKELNADKVKDRDALNQAEKGLKRVNEMLSG